MVPTRVRGTKEMACRVVQTGLLDHPFSSDCSRRPSGAQYTTPPPRADGSAGGPGYGGPAAMPPPPPPPVVASEGGFSPGLLPAHVNVAVRDIP